MEASEQPINHIESSLLQSLFLGFLQDYDFWRKVEVSFLRGVIQEIPEDIVRACQPQNDHTPLHHVIGANRELDIVKALTDLGIEINAPNHNGNIPLHIAAQRCTRPEVAEHLLQYGADLTYIGVTQLRELWLGIG